MIFPLLQNCNSHLCEHIDEIAFVYNLKDESDIQSICEIYEQNREMFIKLKNTSDDYGAIHIEEALKNANVSPKSINVFISNWQKFAKKHRDSIMNRDKIYLEGVNCLQRNLKENSKKLDQFILENKELVTSNLTKKQIRDIGKGIDSYREFNDKKKEEFLLQETLQYGESGKNIIAYNQLSFDVINEFMTSQYKFGLKDNYCEDLKKIYNNNSALKETYMKYRNLEIMIVEALTSEECFKRVGILRYYDRLNEEKKEDAIKVNMLMNILK